MCVCLQWTSDQELVGADVVDGQHLSSTERQYYSKMCDQLFQKYTSIKSRSVDSQQSPIWKCFVVGDTSTTCKLCKTSLKLSVMGNTTNLSTHLRQYHEKEFTEMMEMQAIKQVPNGCCNITSY